MTWTYNNSPDTILRDEVRFLVGDTDNTDPLTTDEEITYALAKEANATLAASRIARAIAGKFSRFSDKEVGDLNIFYSQRAKQYTDLSNDLEERGKVVGSAAGVYAGGISVDEKEVDLADTDLVQPKFNKNIHNNKNIVDNLINL